MGLDRVQMLKSLGSGILFIFFAGVFNPSLVTADTLLEDSFDRGDGAIIGEGWSVILQPQTCISTSKTLEPVQERTFFTKESKDLKNSPLYDEISQEIQQAIERQKDLESEELGAEIRDGMLFLHFKKRRNARVVQKDVSKKLTRLVYDFMPLYAMGGMDDQAWMGVTIQYLDTKEQVLGEIRQFYYNSVYQEYANSDKIYSSISKGLFDGSSRHAVVEAKEILDEKLTAVDQDKIAKTRISFSASSTLCDASVEGYIDNMVAVLADRAGLLKLTREEMLDIVRQGILFFDKDRQGFPDNWIGAITASHGRERIKGWLDQIPLKSRSNPGELANMVVDLFGVSGEEAYVVGFSVSLLLHYI